MGKKLYVGNLSFNDSMTEAVLRNLFAAIGPVDSVKIVTNPDTGRSRGFAFVEMATQEAAEQASARLNGQVLDGWPITVVEAGPLESRRRASG